MADRTWPSPDGRWRVEVEAWEARNSCWVEAPALVDTLGGETILRFTGPLWSLAGCAWIAGGVVRLDLRKYPGGHVPPQLACEIDCERRTAVLDGRTLALADLQAALEGAIAF